MVENAQVKVVCRFYGYVHASGKKGSNENPCGGCLLLLT